MHFRDAHGAGKLEALPVLELVNGGVPLKFRLHIVDKDSGIQFPVDSGADISVVPRKAFKRLHTLTAVKLYAANRIQIDTYGNKLPEFSLRLRRSFKWKFVVADISGAILGADFLVFLELLVDLKRRRLIEHQTGLTSTGEIFKTSAYGISPIEKTSRYDKLLHEFPQLLLRRIGSVRIHTLSSIIFKQTVRQWLLDRGA